MLRRLRCFMGSPCGAGLWCSRPHLSICGCRPVMPRTGAVTVAAITPAVALLTFCVTRRLSGVAGLHLGKSVTGTAMTVTTAGTGTGMIAVTVMSSVAGTDVTGRMTKGMAGVAAVGAMTTDLKI